MACRTGRRKGEIVGVLGQGRELREVLPGSGPGRAARVAVGEGGFVRSEGYGQLSGQSQRMDAVLTGIQVEQQKAGCCRLGGAMQTSRLRRFLFLRLTDGDAALRPGGQSCPQRASGEQHGAAHQRQQHQQRRRARLGDEGAQVAVLALAKNTEATMATTNRAASNQRTAPSRGSIAG